MLTSYQQFWLSIFLSFFVGIFISVVIYWYIKKRLWTATLREYDIEWPIDFEWKFTKADLILASKECVNGYMQGKCFYAYNIPGLQCDLRIYPNANTEEHRGRTLIFLQINASKERKIAAEFTFSIESANYLSESVKNVYEDFVGYGAHICKIGKFFDRKNKYFVDDEITVKVKGIVKAKRSTVSKISNPVSLKWKIKEDDLKESLKPESSGLLRSKVFNIPSLNGVHYWLEIDTKSLNSKNQARTFLILYVGIGSEKKTEAVAEFFIDSAGYLRVFENIYENYNGYATRLCFTKDLFDPSKRFIVDGYLTIDVSGILMVERIPRMTMKCKNCFVSRFTQKQDPKDFVIIVGEKKIQVHKQLLMDISPVFAGMFGSGMKESTENEMVIKDFSFKVIKAAVKTLYKQNGICCLTMEEIFMLYKFADKYFIESLLDHVEHSLIKIISPSNVCHLMKLSAPESFNIQKLHESCIKFLDKCYKESTPVYGAESLGDKFLATVFLRGFHPISDSVTHL